MKEWFYLSAVFQRIASIVEIPSLNEREQKLFNAPPGTALLQPHSSFRVHRLCAGQHISILCISSAWGGWPGMTLLFRSWVIHFLPISSMFLYNRWAEALGFSIVQHRLWWKYRTMSSWRKAAYRDRAKHSRAVLNAQTMAVSALHVFSAVVYCMPPSAINSVWQTMNAEVWNDLRCDLITLRLELYCILVNMLQKPRLVYTLIGPF